MSIQQQKPQPSLAKRDRAKQEFLKNREEEKCLIKKIGGGNCCSGVLACPCACHAAAFPTPEARDGFLIESLCASVASDLRRLTGLIGREAVGEFLRGEGF